MLFATGGVDGISIDPPTIEPVAASERVAVQFDTYHRDCKDSAGKFVSIVDGIKFPNGNEGCAVFR